MEYRHFTIFLSVLALACLGAFGLFPSSASAQDDISVTVPDVEPDVGETVTLSIEADLGSNEADSYTNMEFTFNSSAIKVVEVRDGTGLSFGSQNFISNVEEDTLRVSNIADDSPVTGSGEFLQIDVELMVDGGTPFELTPSKSPVGESPTSVFESDGDELEITSIDQGRVGVLAQAQFIHNAADPAAGTVDVYLDGALAVDDFSFRSATPFVEGLASGVGIDVGVAPAGSSGPDDIIASQEVTLASGDAHTVVANGVLNPDDFAENPDGESIAFEFFAATGAKSSASSGEVDLRAVHGATDAPTVDIGVAGTVLLDNLTYGDVTADYLSATAEEKLLFVTPGDTSSVVAAFRADLSGLGGSAATVLASGFLDPSANQDGPAFRLVAALPNGDVVTFAPSDVIPVAQARGQGPDSMVTVEGTVTRAFGAYVRLQDPSGPTGASGLVIRQTSDDSLANAFRSDISNGTITQGTRLRISGTLSEFAGLLQVNDADLGSYTVQGQGSLPAAQEVTLSDLQGSAGEDYESELLRVEGLSFPDSLVNQTLEEETTYPVLNDGGTSLEYRVQDSSETAVIGATFPPGTFTYEGVLGQFNDFSGNNEGYQFIPIRVSTGLPVEMAGFEATRSGSSVELRWSTASETNNAGFRVQHEPAGQDGWQGLGFVESRAEGGTTTEGQTYRFGVDQDLEPGTHRFRLKQVDLGGATSLSKVVSVKVPVEGALTLSAPSPNPVSGQATVQFAVKKSAEAEVVLYDVLGQKVRTLYRGTPQAGQSTPLTVETDGLPSGVYVMQLRADGQTQTQRLTVVR